MATSFMQQLVEGGNYEGSLEILAGAIESGEVALSLDEAIELSKLTKKITIPEAKKLIKDGKLTKTVEAYQEAGIVRAGTVGGAGRSKGPKQFIAVGDAKGYPKVYISWEGDKAEDADMSAVDALKADVKAVFEKHCQVETV